MERDIVEIRNKYNSLEDIKLVCPKQFQIVDCAPRDCIFIHKSSMYIGLRIPFHHFFHKVLGSFNIILTQLTPNMWDHQLNLSFCRPLQGQSGSYPMIFQVARHSSFWISSCGIQILYMSSIVSEIVSIFLHKSTIFLVEVKDKLKTPSLWKYR